MVFGCARKGPLIAQIATAPQTASNTIAPATMAMMGMTRRDGFTLGSPAAGEGGFTTVADGGVVAVALGGCGGAVSVT